MRGVQQVPCRERGEEEGLGDAVVATGGVWTGGHWMHGLVLRRSNDQDVRVRCLCTTPSGGGCCPLSRRRHSEVERANSSAGKRITLSLRQARKPPPPPRLFRVRLALL